MMDNKDRLWVERHVAPIGFFLALCLTWLIVLTLQVGRLNSDRYQHPAIQGASSKELNTPDPVRGVNINEQQSGPAVGNNPPQTYWDAYWSDLQERLTLVNLAWGLFFFGGQAIGVSILVRYLSRNLRRYKEEIAGGPQ